LIKVEQKINWLQRPDHHPGKHLKRLPSYLGYWKIWSGLSTILLIQQ